MAKSKKRRRKRSPSKREATEPPPPPARPLLTNAAIFAGLGVLVGAGAGWFLRDARADEPTVTAEGTPAASGSACAAWEKGVCDGVGVQSGDCTEAKSAARIMPDKACASALGEMDATVAALKKGREVCKTLAEKLCKDVGGSSPQMCDMIKKRMETMPAPVCEERSQNYPKLVNQLKQLTNPSLRRPPPQRGPGGPPGGKPGAQKHGPGDGHGHGPHDGHNH